MLYVAVHSRVDCYFFLLMEALVMKCPTCDGKSYVSTTVQTEEGTKRFRKCYVCQDNFQTIESVIEYVFVGRPNESETSYLEEDE